MKFRFIFVLLAFASSLVWAQSDSYRLNAGDAISIYVYGEPDLTFEQLLVGQNGRISYPFLGNLQVAGKTASEMQETLVNGLKPDYLVDPRISVSVVRYRPFFVNGEVRRPGGVEFQPGLTLRKAIALAGGFTERANKKRFSVVSGDDGERSEDEVGLDYEVQPGDIITVQDTFF